MADNELLAQTELSNRREIIRDNLELQLADPTYKRYAFNTGALTFDQINDDTTDVDRLEKTMQRYGWPIETDDGFYNPVDIPHEDFHAFLYEKNVNNRMTNFRALISVPLMEDAALEFTADMPLQRLYGLSPVLHRAYAIAPELMTDIHEVFESFSHLDTFKKAAAMKEYLGKDENAVVLDSIHIAYRMMCRLIKPSEGAPGDVDSHDALTH